MTDFALMEFAHFGLTQALAQAVDQAPDGIANAINSTTVSETAAPDHSLIGLFMQANIIVKAVMLTLLGCSIWCWAIIFDKIVLYARTKKQLDRFERVFWSGQSLEELYRSLADRTPTGMGALFVSAMREWKRSFERGANSPMGLQMRIEKVLNVSLAREVERLERRLGFLASVGSVAVYIGLFGTVVGIMTSFQAIAGSKSTNLAVVAPGIAEALMATAIGLVAAIPALVAYNKLSNEVSKISGRLESFADEFSAILSRQIDERNRKQQQPVQQAPQQQAPQQQAQYAPPAQQVTRTVQQPVQQPAQQPVHQGQPVPQR